MGIRLLLDTNAYSAIRNGHQKAVELFASADEVVLSVVVLGELLFGFRNGTKREFNEQRLSELLADPRCVVADATSTTAEIYGEIAAWLRKAGKPLPPNDLWIAAHQFETGATLVSFDTDFAVIPNLRWIRL